MPPVFRHLLLASSRHRGHCTTVSVHECVCVHVFACELVREEGFEPDPCFSVGEGDQDFLPSNPCICDCRREESQAPTSERLCGDLTPLM